MGTVLVADDSVTIRTICQWVFKGTGHDVVMAESGDEAMQLARQHAPAVIVLDYTLPDHDSYELCRQIKSDPGLSRSAVLMLGGNHAHFDANRASSVGADASINKPFTTADFLGKVDELIGLAASGQVRTLGAPAAPAQPVYERTPTPTPAPQEFAAPPAPAMPPAAPGEAPQPRARFQFPSRGGAPAGGAKRFSFPAGPQGGPPGQSAPTPAEPTPLPAPPPEPTYQPEPVYQPEPAYQAEPAYQPEPAYQAEPAYQYQAPPAPPVDQHGYATPLPSAPPVSAPLPTPAAAPVVAIDEAIVRAEVQAVVKEMLPNMVKTVLKELITKEVMPHLQRWVETKVESMVRGRFE